MDVSILQPRANTSAPASETRVQLFKLIECKLFNPEEIARKQLSVTCSTPSRFISASSGQPAAKAFGGRRSVRVVPIVSTMMMMMIKAVQN